MLAPMGRLMIWAGINMADAQTDKRHFKGVHEVARYFGVSPETVRGWKEEGAPFYLIGKKWQCSYYEMWEWLKKNHYENPVK